MLVVILTDGRRWAWLGHDGAALVMPTRGLVRVAKLTHRGELGVRWVVPAGWVVFRVVKWLGANEHGTEDRDRGA